MYILTYVIYIECLIKQSIEHFDYFLVCSVINAVIPWMLSEHEHGWYNAIAPSFLRHKALHFH